MPAVRRVGAGLKPLLLLVGLIGLVVLLAAGAGGEAEATITVGLLNLVLVVGLFTFVGNSGVLSFGHISFMALGAYATALLTINPTSKSLLLPHLPSWIAGAHLGTTTTLVVVAVGAGILGWLVAIPLMRLTGIAAGIATLSLLGITNAVLNNATSITGGSQTLTGVPTDVGLTQAVIWALVAVVVAFAFSHSRVGLRLRAAREDEIAARAVGIRVDRERRIAFGLGAALMALGGGLYAHYLGALTPDQFYLQFTFLTIAMLVVGGLASLSGAVVGTAALTLVVYVFNQWEADKAVGPLAIHLPAGSGQIALALCMLAILMLRPDGLTRGRELRLAWPRRRSRGAEPGETRPGEA